MTYNPDFRRVRIDPNMATHYIWDVVNDTYLMETDGDGNTTAVYTNQPVRYGKLLSQRRANQTSYYHFDGQASTRQLTDQLQNVTDTYTYAAFGVEVAITGTTVNPFGYAGSGGYYADASAGYNYVRERCYNPAQGRWNSMELQVYSEPNRYNYVSNNPLNRYSPSAHSGLSIGAFILPSIRLFANLNENLLLPFDAGLSPQGLVAAFVSINPPTNPVGCTAGVTLQAAFSLSANAPCDGFFVQRVRVYCRRRACNVPCHYRTCCPKGTHPNSPEYSLNLTYWEAVFVPTGTPAGTNLGNDTISPGGFGPRHNTCGYYRQIGHSRFFCIGTTGHLRILWGGITTFGIDCPTTGGPHTTTSTPAWWDDNEPTEPQATRSLNVRWMCCPCADRIQFADHYP